MRILINYDQIYTMNYSRIKRYGATVIIDGKCHIFHMAGTRSVSGVPYKELRQEIKEKLNVDIGAMSKLKWHTCGEVGWSIIDTENTRPSFNSILKEVEDEFKARIETNRKVELNAA